MLSRTSSRRTWMRYASAGGTGHVTREGLTAIPLDHAAKTATTPHRKPPTSDRHAVGAPAPASSQGFTTTRGDDSGRQPTPASAACPAPTTSSPAACTGLPAPRRSGSANPAPPASQRSPAAPNAHCDGPWPMSRRHGGATSRLSVAVGSGPRSWTTAASRFSARSIQCPAPPSTSAADPGHAPSALPPSCDTFCRPETTTPSAGEECAPVRDTRQTSHFPSRIRVRPAVSGTVPHARSTCGVTWKKT